MKNMVTRGDLFLTLNQIIITIKVGIQCELVPIREKKSAVFILPE